ncbi:NADH dehydrogenase-like protein [Leptotrombidium deliense]|uniref:NADH dehydrogenase-like protein n=1 Tax=Leptotrombidium deliense TaxID=299467 RepID=A0A443SAF7_9ACAR|nr:NADH dehydrogenase-like protein [Leptotrombidium deliense]
MPITDDVYIPPESETVVQEITVSSPVLRSIGQHMGKVCDQESKEYMLCHYEERDPRTCLKAGKALTNCGLEFLYKVKEFCQNEVETHARCLEWNSGDMRPYYCREQQAAADYCLSNKLGVERPPMGYFTSVRLHDSERPKPKTWIPKFEKLGELDPDAPLPPARGGKREFGFF